MVRAPLNIALISPLLLSLLSPTSGCAGKEPSPQQTVEPQSNDTDADADADAGAHDDALTGLVDEETFKALHQLSEAETPTLHGQTIELAGTKAYLSLPADASGPLPAVVVIHEWWGLNDHIRHWSDRLAADGYAALAVDLYGGQVAGDPEGAMSLMKAVDQGKATAVLTAAHEFLAADPRVSAKKRGVIGWCFGGGWSLRQAIAHPDLDAAVIYYGHPVTDPAELGKIEASLLGVFANQDQAIPPASVDEFVSALEAAGKTIELYRYDAVHAFANPSSANYDQASAGDAWEHVRAFLARELK